ncbi:hypothetical protein ACSQ67_009471 [Phaseolus vulgaris]
MGNTLSVVLDNYIGTAPIPCHLQLGQTTSIDLSRDLTSEKDDSGVVNETFKVLYKVDNKTCDICLVRHSNAEKVKFVINDIAYLCTYAKFDMVITETNYIRIGRFRWMTIDSKKSTKTNKSFNAWGGVVDTTVHLYGNGRRRGLLVKESKKNTREEETTVVTVAHYFVTSSGTSFDRSSGTDIGLSVVAKCGVSNGKFDITVEGPQQHPVSALLYMFDEVNRTGIWKPTMCPHCDHKRRGKMFWQSDSEDSDSVSIPVPRATPKPARGVSNGGRFKGNDTSRNCFIEMGNTPSGLRLLGTRNYSYTIKLGKEATISVKRGRMNDCSRKQTWELSYNVNKLTSTLSIVKTTNKISDEVKISITILDYIPEENPRYTETPAAALDSQANKLISIIVHKDEDGLLEVFLIDGSVYYKKLHIKNRRISEGISTGTSFSAYGCGTRIGLFIIEDKKKSNEKQPYMLTLAHYYVNSGSGGNFGGSGVDVGFSVVVKIGVHNGVLDFSVDGPVENPTSALIYMIQEVTRTGTWKLSACPHCKNIQWQQRRLLSESEDSDTPFPTPPSHGTQRNNIFTENLHWVANIPELILQQLHYFCIITNLAPASCSTLVHGFTSYKTAAPPYRENQPSSPALLTICASIGLPFRNTSLQQLHAPGSPLLFSSSFNLS